MERKKEAMDMEVFKKAVDEFAEMGGTALDFNVTIGDPLLDPLLLERARYAKRYPQFDKIGFVTTLQWLHRWDMDEFFESIGWLSLSITLSGRETYKDFFGVDKYDQMLENLLMLLKENHKRGNPLEYLIQIKPTDESVESVLNHPDFKMVDSLVWQNLADTLDANGYFVDDWLGSVELPAYLKLRPLYPRPFRPCALLFGGMMVYSNGNVGACSCRDFEASSELILGNIKTDNIADLWNGPKLHQIRRDWRIKNRVPEICKSCRHYVY